MSTKFCNTILNFFFGALVLTALTACGGFTIPDFDDDDEDKTTEDTDTVLTPGTKTPDPDTKTPEMLLSETPLIDYTFPTAEMAPTNGWAKTVIDLRTEEYQKAGEGVDRIGAAYAYAREVAPGKVFGTNYTGMGLQVAIIGQPIDRAHADLAGQLVAGYKAKGKVDGGADTGTCASSDTRDMPLAPDAPAFVADCGDDNKQGTHIAGIIAGESGNFAEGGLIQGIAYNAQIKPIDIVTGDASPDERAEAIAAAATTVVTMISSGWDVSADGTYEEDGDSNPGTPDDIYHYETVSVLDTTIITFEERGAWAESVAVANTIMVIAAGDQGHNSETGKVQLYTDVARTEGNEHGMPVLWSSIKAGNQASARARLPTDTVADVATTTAIRGKWLSVIALDSDNVIASFSNGCGDTKAFCLGAPGVAINSAIPGTGDAAYEEQSGTAVAAAHVTGAIAILRSAFPTTASTDLVRLLLDTATPLVPSGETVQRDDDGILIPDDVYGYGVLNLAAATIPVALAAGASITSFGNQRLIGANIDNSGITLPTSFGESLNGFTAGFTDDYNRSFIGRPTRITRTNAAFTLGDTIATWDSPELQNVVLDSNSKMQFTNYDADSDTKDTLIFTHNLPNHTIGFSYNEESKTPDFKLTDNSEDLHFQKIRPIASDLMQVNSTHKLGKALSVKNAITSGEFDTGNRFNEAMANLSYAGENSNLTIGAGRLQEYGQFLGASGTGAYQLSDATSSQITHLAISQNLPKNSAIKLKYTGFKTEVDMRYDNFARINDLTANEYQLSLTKKQLFGKNDSAVFELIQPFAVSGGKLQQSTVLGYTADGDYNNVTQNYDLKPAKRRQQIRMTWQNQLNLKSETKLFISMQYENHVNNLRDKENSQILGGISTRF